MRKAFSVLEELATDVNMDAAVLDAEDLWDDLETTELEDVRLTFQCTVNNIFNVLLVYIKSFGFEKIIYNI